MYAMLGPEGPSISADGLQVVADLSSPATANQPQLTSQYQASMASAQEGTASTFDLQGHLDPLAVASPTPEGVTSSFGPSPTATSTPVPDCEPASSGIYCVYTVKAGDTLSAIAQRFGISSSGDLSPAEMLALSNKPAVVETNSIETGLKLRVPLENGIVHTVFSGETLSAIADIYGVTVADIQEANGGASAVVGQNLLIPDPQYQRLPVATAAAPEPTATPEPEPEEIAEEDEVAVEEEEPAALAPEEVAEPATAEPPPPEPAAPEATATAPPATATPQATATPRRSATATPTPKPAGAPSSAGFIWPGQGPISSYFGAAHPLGIDIDFFANPNQPVVAVAAGTVTFAGGDPCCSYGYYVIVDHGNGFQTLYAHFSQFGPGITTGTKVAQGQTLGYGGHTGFATGDHLHFEVHLNGAIVNPLTYLP